MNILVLNGSPRKNGNVAKALKKEAKVTDITYPQDLMDSVNGLDSYLNIFGEILAERIQQSFTPKFDPNKDEYDTWVNYYDDSCYHAGIELYNAQKACIQSSVNNLKVNKATFVIAEMSANHLQNYDRAVEIIKKAKILQSFY